MWAFLFLNFHYYKTKKRKSRFNQPQCPEEGWGGNEGGAGVGKVYQISSISYCLGWDTVHGEVDTKDSHQILLPSTPRPRVGAPPLPHFLPCFGKLVRVPDGPVPSLSENKQSRAQPGSCPGQGRRVCVCRGRKQGGSVILLENKLHPFSIFIKREDPEQSSTRPRCV